MNKVLSNYPNNQIPFTGLIVALFTLVTIYFMLLLIAFKKPFHKMIVSYTIIVILLTTVVLVSKYYTVLYEGFIHGKSIIHEGFIADYPQKKVTNEEEDKLNKSFTLSKTPFASIYNVDNMCSTSTVENLDHDDISWKCRVRDTFNPDSFSLHTSADDIPKTLKYSLKYDGIYDINN